jgi:S-adenosylmethionine synthetase
VAAARIVMRLSLQRATVPHPDRLPVEVVERKGRGHPDTLSDAIAEEASLPTRRRVDGGAGIR